MRKRNTQLLLILFTSFFSSSSFCHSESRIATKNVTVIPRNGEETLQKQTVLVENGIIVDWGDPRKAAENDFFGIIAGTGRYLIPGLSDLHVDFHMEQGGPVQKQYLDLIQVADSVYVFKPKIDWTHSNCTVIIGSDGLLIIDTFLQTNYADEAVRRLKEISTLPVTHIFNTHGHADHVMGNSIFKEAFPNCKIIMNKASYDKYPKNFKYGNDMKATAEQIPVLEKEIAESKSDNGLVLTDQLKAFWKWQLDECREYVAFYKPIKPANADIVFSDKLTLYFGAQQVELLPVEGEGHDVGDAMAWLPGKKLLVAGDIIVAPTPYAIRGRVSEMERSLDHIIRMNPSIIIPGHGDLMKGVTYAKDEKELLLAVKAKALEAIENKVPYKEAKSKITIPAELESKFTQNNDVRKWAMSSFFTNWVIYGTYLEKGEIKKN